MFVPETFLGFRLVAFTFLFIFFRVKFCVNEKWVNSNKKYIIYLRTVVTANIKMLWCCGSDEKGKIDENYCSEDFLSQSSRFFLCVYGKSASGMRISVTDRKRIVWKWIYLSLRSFFCKAHVEFLFRFLIG